MTSEMNGLNSGATDIDFTHGEVTADTFDCGINDPDVVIVSDNRQDNDWLLYHQKAVSQLNNKTKGMAINMSSNLYRSDQITISGSTVSLNGYYASPAYFFAIKFK